MARVPCHHCGLPVPPAEVRPEDPHPFCCNGCRQVFGLLNGLGLTDYYRLRDLEGAAPVAAAVSGRAFQDFDDPVFAQAHVRDTGHGTCRTSLYLEGVHCAACVWLVERLPSLEPGVVSVRLDLPRAQAEVEWDPAAVPLSAVGRALDRLGYAPHPWRRRDIQALRRAEDRSLLAKVGVAGASMMATMHLQGALYVGDWEGIEPDFAGAFRWMAMLVSLPAVLYSARPFYASAWAGLRHRVPHVDLPIALAIVGAFAYSVGATFAGRGPVYFDSVAGLVALLLGGRYLQARAQRSALERTEALRGVAFFEFARLLPDDGGPSREVPAEALRPGQRIEVLSGDLLPADGVVDQGESAIDNAVLTGEAVPVPVGPGDPVTAGATNRGGRLAVRVAAVGDATRVGTLLRRVDEAAARRAPLVDRADRWSRWFVWGILVLSALSAALWWGHGPDVALERVIALLVVACPCALALGTPVAMAVALSRAAKAGIFLKDPGVIERLGKVRTILLDKTGTLTLGRLALAEYHGDPGALALAAALESGSTHPVARALRDARQPGREGPDNVRDFREVFGRGVSGTVGGRAVAVGNAAHLADLGLAVDGDWPRRADEAAAAGRTPILVAVDGAVRGLAALEDPLRPEAAATLQALRRRGWRPGILSGDHPDVVARVAAALGIPPEDARGGLSPEQKHDAVAARVADPDRPGAVMVVGDGVNDAAALAAADVGVAVHGGAGPSLAAADVVLNQSGLIPLEKLEFGARRTVRIILRNLAFSLCYNAAGVALAMTGIVGPLVAAVLMPLSSLTVILSSVAGRTFATGRVGAGPVGGRWT